MTDTSDRLSIPSVEIPTRLEHLFEGERNALANMANMASLLYHSLLEVNWVGFYFIQGSELVLGPFQGKPACVRIPAGKGVCGTAVERRETLIVPDVHAFPGHIACDPDSRSEMVLPLRSGDTVIGVLDLDSPRADRFTDDDAAMFNRCLDLLLSGSDGWDRFYSTIET